MAWTVVIAGGGFGGLYAARRLERRLPRHSARILLVADANYMLYTPLLPGAAAGSLEPRHVVVPLREELNWTDVRIGRVTGADPALADLRIETAGGRAEALRYDQLVLALGSVSRVLPVEGLAEHAVGFKELADAIALRNRTIWNLEVAESIADPEERREWLTLVFVGAGYAGVEGIAELQDFVASVIDRYPRCRLDGTRWILVEAEDRPMQEIPASLAEFATRELRGRGMEIQTGTRLDAVDERSATLSTGEIVPTRTVCWTAGVKPPAVVRELGLPLTDAGRIDVDEFLRVKGPRTSGRSATRRRCPTPRRAGASRALRRRSTRSGRAASSRTTSPPRSPAGGSAASGTAPSASSWTWASTRRWPTMLGLRLRGFAAWFAARTYHLAMMPGMARRLRLMADWTVGLLFGRAAAELGQLGHPPPLGSYFEQEQLRRDEVAEAAPR